MHCLIAIPTYNRAGPVARAVRAAFDQYYDSLSVIVIDDGSTDHTRAVLEPWFDQPNFTYIQLARNIGTARAKNVALAVAQFDAITFHDSDDIPDPEKVFRQARILQLPNVQADSCLNWAQAGLVAGDNLNVGVALTTHTLLTADGQRHIMRRSLSMVDDFFPQLQMAAGPPGDWILINSGLFRRSVFRRVGGFADGIEEDRELRNRIIMAGEVVWLIDEPLLLKIESHDSLTREIETGYASARRRRDRERIWAKIEAWRETGHVAPEPIDLSGVEIAFCSRWDALVPALDLPMSSTDRDRLRAIMRGAMIG